jgi:hypothetical protein
LSDNRQVATARTHESGGDSDSKLILPVVDQFPQESFMRYNLACYACQLGLLEEAKLWLEKAFEISDEKKMKPMALEDSDLEPMWKEIGKL